MLSILYSEIPSPAYGARTTSLTAASVYLMPPGGTIDPTEFSNRGTIAATDQYYVHSYISTTEARALFNLGDPMREPISEAEICNIISFSWHASSLPGPCPRFFAALYLKPSLPTSRLSITMVQTSLLAVEGYRCSSTNLRTWLGLIKYPNRSRKYTMRDFLCLSFVIHIQDFIFGYPSC